MSMHKIELSDIEREGLIRHGLERNIGVPSQLADSFRQGVAWGLKKAQEQDPAWVTIDEKTKGFALESISLRLQVRYVDNRYIKEVKPDFEKITKDHVFEKSRDALLNACVDYLDDTRMAQKR